MPEVQYPPGALVTARGRDWIVISSQPPLLTLRPLTGGAETTLHTEVEEHGQTHFAPPDSEKDAGDHASARLLSDAVRLKLRDGAGAFRSFGQLSFEPRHYQYVPLLMALQQSTVRLLVADDVGIGKTVEAGMIAAELLARHDIDSFAVLCPPHLCDQWQNELQEKFNITAETVTAAKTPRLERNIPEGTSLFKHYPYTVVSLDFIKSNTRRDEFVQSCPSFVIVDEAHTRILRTGTHQGYQLLSGLAENPDRHMVFLTATPHSGDDRGFYNLLTLLNEEFAGLEGAQGNARRRLRERLGQHFVQRMRQDITGESAYSQDNPFPEREPKEAPYTAAGTPYGDLLLEILGYCRAAVEESDNRMNALSMLALMRCISSSPAAAQQALQARMANADIGEEEMHRYVMDTEAEEGSNDMAPPIEVQADSALKTLAEKAAKIAKSGDDPKLQTLYDELGQLLKEGRKPIIYCRYIATADYLANQIKENKEKFEGYSVESVTGEIPPTARARAVAELSENEKRILVATDCLSEGINLQEYFDSVIHYDLSWNPTRHQQREGRVDRLGQRSPVVPTRMLYGRDNPVDGVVLEVIIRKADRIRRELGVYVPLPDDTKSMTEALLKAVLMRRPSGEKWQPSLFNELDEAKHIEGEWEKASSKVQERRRTIFAQSKIKPEEIITETTEIVKKLGDSETVRRFVCSALRRRGITVNSSESTPNLVTVEYSSDQHPDLAPWLSSGKSTLSFKLKGTPPKAVYLHRAHRLVRHLAEQFFEYALLPESQYVRRAGAYFSMEVSEVVAIAILRMRHRLHTTKGDIQLAEETAIIRIDGVSDPKMKESEEVLLLLDADPAGNIDPNRRALEVDKAKERIEGLQAPINALARQRAKELHEAYERVRKGVTRKSNITAIDKAEAEELSDIIGVYVVLPFGGEA